MFVAGNFTRKLKIMVSALNQAVVGIMGSQTQFTKSATNFINSFTPTLSAASGDAQAVEQFAQLPQTNVNPFAGNNISAEALVASSLAGLFSPSATDPATSLINMLQAQTAFSANISAFQSIDNTQEELLNIFA